LVLSVYISSMCTGGIIQNIFFNLLLKCVQFPVYLALKAIILEINLYRILEHITYPLNPSDIF